MNKKFHAGEEAIEEDLKGLLRTRQNLTGKLQSLEQRVEEHVADTKDAAWNIIDNVKSTAKGVFNPSALTSRKSWMMLGVSVAVGLLARRMKQRNGGVYAYYPSKADAADVMPADGSAQNPKGVYPFYTDAQSTEPTGSKRQEQRGKLLEPVSSLWGDITAEFGNEGQRLRNAALMIGRSFTQDLARIAVRSLINAFDQSQSQFPRKTIPRRDSGDDKVRSRAA